MKLRHTILLLLSFAATLAFLADARAAGLVEEWNIVPGSDPIEAVAAEDLQRFLAERLGASASIAPAGEDDARSIHIGTATDHPRIAAAHADRPFTLTDSPESYHLAFRDGALYIVGREAKGAMNGVYRLINRGADVLRSLDPATLDEHGSPVFRYRIGDHLRTQKMPPGWSDDDQGRWYAQHFVNIVWGEKFGPPLPYEVRKKYGLGLMLEASLPPTPEGTHWGETGHKSPWWDGPANASAVYRWGRPSWYGDVKVVDPFDPVGRQAYLDHFNNLLERNPDTKIMYCIFGDYSWAPNEDSTRISDGKRFEHTQEEAIREILVLMREAIGERDVIPAVWMWLLFPKQGKEKFMEEMTAEGIGVMYNEASDNDCWTYLRDNFDEVSLKLGPDGKTKFGRNYLPLVSIGGTCESVRPGLAMPLPHVGATKTLRLLDAGVQNFIIWWGSCEGWAYQANIEAMAELVWNPQAFDRSHADPFNPENPEPLIGRIARRDFGDLAPDVLRFWEAFERALVDVDLAGNRTGLQNQSWYQRTGNYLIFIHGHNLPLIPSELARKEKVASLYPWILRPHAEENWAMVRANVEAALQQLDALRHRDGIAPDVQWRLDAMHQNIAVFFRVFANMHNHMQAAQVMERHAHLAHDSARLKAELAGIIANDIANTQALVELVKQFPENFFLTRKAEPDGSSTRDADIRRLEEKIARSRKYLETPASGIVELPARIEAAEVLVADGEGGQWTLEITTDGQSWQPVAHGIATPGVPSMAAFEPIEARAARLTGPAGKSARLTLYAPPVVNRIAAVNATLRPAFHPEITRYELVAPHSADLVELKVDPADAPVRVQGEPMAADGIARVRMDGGEAAEMQIAFPSGARSYQLNLLRNLAAGATVAASSADSKFPASNAIDGQAAMSDDASRWVSRTTDEHWLTLDLHEPRTFGRAVIGTGHQRATTHSIRALKLQASEDGQSWYDIPGAAVSGNNKNVIHLEFNPVTSRHVRLVVTQTPDNRARVYELELYAPDTHTSHRSFTGGL